MRVNYKEAAAEQARAARQNAATCDIEQLKRIGETRERVLGTRAADRQGVYNGSFFVSF